MSHQCSHYGLGIRARHLWMSRFIAHYLDLAESSFLPHLTVESCRAAIFEQDVITSTGTSGDYWIPKAANRSAERSRGQTTSRFSTSRKWDGKESEDRLPAFGDQIDVTIFCRSLHSWRQTILYISLLDQYWCNKTNLTLRATLTHD